MKSTGKLVGRSLLILALALVVVGAVMAFAQSGYASNSTRRAEFRERPASSQPAGGRANATARTGNDFERRGERGRGANLFGLVSVLQSFVIISLIVLGVTRLDRLLERRRHKISVQ